ncbi:hypothetical protein BZA77DRAFT_357579 [Pyronema omphalodes]|nr:hypothetical protein BZA77DRAFT_357579 [Pyronema omphalodes]
MDQNSLSSSTLEWELSLSTAIAENYSSFLSPPSDEDQNSIVAAWMKDPRYNIFDTKLHPLQTQVNAVRQYIIRLVHNWKAEWPIRTTTNLLTGGNIQEIDIEDFLKYVATRAQAPGAETTYPPEFYAQLEQLRQQAYETGTFAVETSAASSESTVSSAGTDIEEIESPSNEGLSPEFLDTDPNPTGDINNDFDMDHHEDYEQEVLEIVETTDAQDYEQELLNTVGPTEGHISYPEQDISLSVTQANINPSQGPWTMAEGVSTEPEKASESFNPPQQNMAHFEEPDWDEILAAVEASFGADHSNSQEEQMTPEEFEAFMAQFPRMPMFVDGVDPFLAPMDEWFATDQNNNQNAAASSEFNGEYAVEQIINQPATTPSGFNGEYVMTQTINQNGAVSSVWDGDATPQWLRDIGDSLALRTDANGFITFDDFDMPNAEPAGNMPVPMENNFPVGNMDAAANFPMVDNFFSNDQPPFELSDNSNGAYLPDMNSTECTGSCPSCCTEPAEAQTPGTEPTACCNLHPDWGQDVDWDRFIASIQWEDIQQDQNYVDWNGMLDETNEEN